MHCTTRPNTTRKALKIPEMYDAAIEGKLKALWLMGEDVVQTDPNTHHVLKAMSNLELVVVQEIFMSETCKQAHVVLPAASFLEKAAPLPTAKEESKRFKKLLNPLRVPGPMVKSW